MVWPVAATSSSHAVAAARLKQYDNDVIGGVGADIYAETAEYVDGRKVNSGGGAK